MNKVFIIAEAGVNHNGSVEIALKLCDAAKKANVDAIKFQTWQTEKILTHDAQMANYQKANTGNNISQYDMIKALELNYKDFREVKKYCEKIGLQFLSTPDESDSLDFLIDIGLEIIKVGSGEITNIPFLRKVGSKRRKVILSTGMSYLADVEKAYYTLKESGAPEISLLHCTTNYPCPMEEVNLQAMLTLKEAFKTNIGYSDHTEGIEVPIAAVALGAQIIEKHFTLDKSDEGPDHKASLDPIELSSMVLAIRNIEKALGNGLKVPNKSEIEIKKVVLKTIVASTQIKKGELLTEKNITVKRAGTGIPATLWDSVIGTKAFYNYNADEVIKLL